MWEQRWERWNRCSSNACNSSIICERVLSTALYENCPFSFSPPWAVTASHSLFIWLRFSLIFRISVIEMLRFCMWLQTSWNTDSAQRQATWHSCGRPSFSLGLLSGQHYKATTSKKIMSLSPIIILTLSPSLGHNKMTNTNTHAGLTLMNVDFCKLELLYSHNQLSTMHEP